MMASDAAAASMERSGLGARTLPPPSAGRKPGAAARSSSSSARYLGFSAGFGLGDGGNISGSSDLLRLCRYFPSAARTPAP